MKLTPWFPVRIKPARVGVYEVKLEVIEDRLGGTAIEQGFCYWGGDMWAVIKSTPDEAYARRVMVGSQHKAWRGLANGASK